MAEDRLNPLGFPPEETAAAEGSGSRNRLRLSILGVVVALAVGYMIYAAFPGNALYFLTVSEFMGGEEYQDGRVLRVSGKLVPGSFQREADSTLARFRLVDQPAGAPDGALIDVDTIGAAGNPTLQAAYVGVMPDLFFNPHSEIILEGSYGADDVFLTDNILVKCPSKYQSLEEAPPDGYGDYNPGA